MESSPRHTLEAFIARRAESPNRSPQRSLSHHPRLPAWAYVSSLSEGSHSRPQRGHEDDHLELQCQAPFACASEYQWESADGERLGASGDTLRFEVDRLKREMEDDAKSINAAGCVKINNSVCARVLLQNPGHDDIACLSSTHKGSKTVGEQGCIDITAAFRSETFESESRQPA